MNERELRGVVCLMQPNFIDILKRNKANGIVFSVTTFDGSDTIHVRVARTDKSVQKDISTSVTFKVFEGLPRNYANLHLIASGLISNLADLNQPKVAILVSENDHIRAFVKLESDKPVEEAAVLSLPSRFHLFNNDGIIEPRLLADRKVAVVGLGSGGSHVAMELAKSGVGKFVLVDYDRIELQNVIRHVCGLRDLGRLKTNAMRDRILEKNPFAEIEICNIDVNNLERARQIFKGCDIIIAATDNITSRFNINTLSLELGIVTLYGACSIRASGGQVVRVRPNDGPCFSCIYVDAAMEAMQEELSSFAQAREAFPPYIGDDEVEANIQLGLSSDIVPIANMLVKVALLELCRGENTALTSLEEDLDVSFYMWANRREQEYSRYSEDSFHRSNEAAILRWYQLRSKRRPDCMICQNMEGSAKNREFFTSKGS